MNRIRAHADEWHCDPGRIAVIGFSAGGHLAANLATTASDDVMRKHGYDPDAVRPDALVLGYPVVTSGPLAHRGSFDCLLGDEASDHETLESVQLYSILNGEALNPEHPAHHFFIGRHMRQWEMICSMNWLLPPDMTEDRFYDLYTLAMSAMDGLQYR